MYIYIYIYMCICVYVYVFGHTISDRCVIFTNRHQINCQSLIIIYYFNMHMDVCVYVNIFMRVRMRPYFCPLQA